MDKIELLFNQAVYLLDSKNFVQDYNFYNELVTNPTYRKKIHFNYLAKEKNDYIKAIELFTEVIELKSTHAISFDFRGVAKYMLKDYDGAISDYTKAIEIDPNYAFAYYNRGNAKRKLLDYDGAISDYTKAIEIDPNYAFTYNKRGDIKIEINDFEGAILDYTRAILNNKNEGCFYIKSGNAKKALNDYYGAISDYNKAIEYDRINEFIYINRGNAKKAIRDYDGAIVDYTRAININPNYNFCYKNRGDAKMALKDYDGAISDYTKAIEMKQNEFTCIHPRGGTLYLLKDYDGNSLYLSDAMSDFSKAIEIEHDYEEWHTSRGNAKMALKDYDGAISDYTMAIRNHDTLAYYNRGSAKRALKDYDGAITDYTEAIEVKSYASFYNSRGIAKEALKDYDGAISDYTTAIEANSDYSSAYNNRAIVKMALKDYDGAIIDCTAAINIDPSFEFAYNIRARAKQKQKDYNGAIADYTKAIETDQKDKHIHYTRGRGGVLCPIKVFDDVISDYSEDIKSEHDLVAYNNRGVAKGELRDYDGAIADYTKAIEINPNYANAYYNRGIAKKALNDNNGYEEDLALYYKKIEANKSSQLEKNSITDAQIKSKIDVQPIEKPKEMVNKKVKLKEKLPESIKELNNEISDNLFVNYELTISESKDNYTVIRIPQKGCIVRTHRFGKSKKRGCKEESFQNSIQKHFSTHFVVLGDVRLNTGKDTRPFEPDIAIIEKKKDNNIRIDIEIDEPYAGITRQPTHCKGDNLMRDNYFVDRGWLVIRFSEFQVHSQENECLKYIASIINTIDSNYTIPNELNKPINLKSEPVWDIVQAQKWEKEKYREKYLNHEFGEIVEEPETVERGFNQQEINEENLVEPTKIGIADKIESIGFNETNAHPRDERITFYPEPHIYTIDNVPVPSASTIISKFFPEFDSFRAANNLNQNHLLHGLLPEEIVQTWNQRGLDAANLGTHLHEQIEKYYLNQPYHETEEFHLFKQFVSEHQSIIPYRSEWCIFDDKYNVAGTIDLIARDGKNFQIYDWKRSKKVINSYNYEPIKIDDWGKCGVGKLSDIPDTSYNRYCLQQSLYRFILENNYNMKISRMYLVILHPDYDRYHKVETPYWKDKIEYILNTL